MHGRQQKAEGDDPEHRLVQHRRDSFGEAGETGTVPAPPVLHEGGRQLQPEHEDVGHHAEGHLEQDGVEVPVPEEDGHLVDVPVASDVDEDTHARQGVAQRAGEDGRTHQRVVAPLVEHVDQDRHGIAAAGQRRAGDDVVGDPDAPGVAVAESGHGAETAHETPGEQGRAHGDQQQPDAHGPGEHSPAYGQRDVSHEPTSFSATASERRCRQTAAPSSA